MKNYSFLISLIFTCICGKASSQDYIEPQWKFYFAFEDATGARDTMWIGLDSAVTTFGPGENTQFGEVPFDVPEDVFSVYSDYSFTEWTQFKVSNIESSMNVNVYASNYTLPLILSWDTALFNAPVLQETAAGPLCNPRLESSYLEGMTNANWLHNQYSMIFDNHVFLPEAPWLLQPHFPMTFYTDRGHNCDPLTASHTALANGIDLYPNPCVDVLNLRTDALLQSMEVYNLQGQLLLQQQAGLASGAGPEMRIDVNTLPPGMYLMHVQDAEGRRGLKKFVKAE